MSLSTDDWIFIAVIFVLCFVFTGIGMWSSDGGILARLLRWTGRGKK